ncbi:MAG: EAL domain-containing protein [Verrucomicrobia bacterium]|nr:EAL domain-containing protein [Verrucomicrobiota bacterium]MBI3870812.1 EAL domain-containing protein [Verrucomicrobiota bacterium]
MEGSKPLTILYAEDDAVSAKLLGRTLQNLGYEAHGFVNGHQALEWFEKIQPPIIISDWMMPQMDGLEFCRRVRALDLPYYTYFILLTANSSETNYHKAMDHGVDDFLAKPFRREDLHMRLRVAERIVRQRWETEAKIRSLAHFPADNPNPILQANRDGAITYANQASLSLLRLWKADVGGALPDSLLPLLATVARGEQAVSEAELYCDNRTYSFAVTSVSEDGLIYLYGHDITARKRAETDLIAMRNRAVMQSLQDALTGIGNRVLLEQRLPELLQKATQDGKKLALVLVDIDNFKDINDSYGHKVGDQALIHVGHTLRDHLKSRDCVCRWGGDELVILISELQHRSQMRPICERLIQTVKEGLGSSDLPKFTLSMGFAVFPDDAPSGETLLQKADQALYQAKADGRDCWREYLGESKILQSTQHMIQRLTAAIDESRLTAYFQPVWDVVNQRPAGVESLARWVDPELGYIPPDEFIPLAEAKGLIIPLSRVVMRKSLETMRDWRSRGYDLTLSLNLSKRQLVETHFLTDLYRMVDEFQLPHDRVIFEVTERQSILGHALGRQRIEAMIAAGFRLSLDDFGSGYSSFDLVGEIPFHELKIYGGLIRKMNTPQGRRIVQAIVEMGLTLGLTVVAEGAEQEEEVNILREMGTQKIQGYYYSKPLPQEKLFAYLEEQTRRGRFSRPANVPGADKNVSF